MKVFILTVTIEAPDDLQDLCVTKTEAEELLSVFENEAGRRGYSIYDTTCEEAII